MKDIPNYQIKNYNGLRTVWVPDKSKKFFYIKMLVNVGYRHINDLNRFSAPHFLEHIIAKYIADKGPIAKKLRKKGVHFSSNASTGSSQTSYYVSGVKDNSRDILEMVLSAYFQNNIGKSYFEKEKNSIIIEVLSKSTKESIKTHYGLMELIYGKNYAVYQDYNKHAESARNMTLKYLKEFKKKYYTPNNSILLIGGNYNKRAMKKILNRYFRKYSKIMKNTIKVENIPPQILYKNPRINNIIDKNRKTHNVIFAFPSFTGHDIKKYYIAKILRNVLSNRGRLSKILRDKEGIAYSPHFNYSANSDHGYMEFEIDVSEKNIPKLIKSLFGIIRKLKHKNIKKSEFNKAINSYKYKLDFDEEIFYYINYIGNCIFDNYPIERNKDSLKYLKSIKYKDIKNLCKEYLRKENMFVLIYGKKINIKEINNIINNTKL